MIPSPDSDNAVEIFGDLNTDDIDISSNENAESGAYIRIPLR